jgi:hypothetical protein
MGQARRRNPPRHHTRSRDWCRAPRGGRSSAAARPLGNTSSSRSAARRAHLSSTDLVGHPPWHVRRRAPLGSAYGPCAVPCARKAPSCRAVAPFTVRPLPSGPTRKYWDHVALATAWDDVQARRLRRGIHALSRRNAGAKAITGQCRRRVVGGVPLVTSQACCHCTARFSRPVNFQPADRR